MNPNPPSFFVTGGTLRSEASCYVERRADHELMDGLLHGDFCYVLTARQMGKSSLMNRAAARLKAANVSVVTLDLTAIGQNLTNEQWYDGLTLHMARQLGLEEQVESFWKANDRLGGLQRTMAALQQVMLPNLAQTLQPTAPSSHPDSTSPAAAMGRTGPGTVPRLVIFVDEIDVVRSLPFSTDEFFAAIRGCYNRRPIEPDLERLTFCLLGTASPAELIRDSRTTPFHIGRRIEVTDFTPEEASPLIDGLALSVGSSRSNPARTLELFDRILLWTNGHPYLTQRLCMAAAEVLPLSPDTPANSLIDMLCEQTFLTPRARELDDNLLFVRERILRGAGDPIRRLCLYEEIRSGKIVRDNDADEVIDQLRLAGIVRSEYGELQVRNRIYHEVFDDAWTEIHLPFGELEKPGGERLRLKNNCFIGRAALNDVVLLDDKVSRRHAQIQMLAPGDYTLQDLGSSNGTFLNERALDQPLLLQDGARIDIGPFRLIFHQVRKPATSALIDGVTGFFQRTSTTFTKQNRPSDKGGSNPGTTPGGS